MGQGAEFISGVSVSADTPSDFHFCQTDFFSFMQTICKTGRNKRPIKPVHLQGVKIKENKEVRLCSCWVTTEGMLNLCESNSCLIEDINRSRKH